MSRNGEGLFKRNQIWSFRYKDPETGKWPEKSTGKKKKAEAWREKQHFLDALRDGTLPSDTAQWTLRQAADHWLDWRSATKSQKTASVERRLMRQVCKVFGDARILKTLNPHDLDAYQARRRKTVGPRTVNLELFCLIQILKRAHLWVRFREHYHPLRVPKASIGKVVPKEGMERLVEHASSKPEWQVAFCAFILGRFAGCRGGEVKRLRIADVNLDEGSPFLRIRAEIAKNGYERIAPLNATALWAVTKLLARARLLGAEHGEHFLLPLNRSRHTRKDDPHRGERGYDPTNHQQSWSSAWRSLRQAAGLQGFRMHDSRHGFITAAAESGVPVEVTRSIVGHLDQEMTARYTHIQSGALQKAVAAVDAEAGSLFSSLVNALEDEGTTAGSNGHRKGAVSPLQHHEPRRKASRHRPRLRARTQQLARRRP